MKSIVLVAFVVASLVVFGCTQILPPSSMGRDFPGENVGKIVRGKTTDKDLIQMFGEPLSKTIISETEKNWIYTYASGTATVVRHLTSVETKVLSRILCNFFMSQFLEERQVSTHFSYRV